MSADMSTSMLSAGMLSTGTGSIAKSGRTDGSRTLVTKPSYNSIIHDEPADYGGITFPELDGREPVEQLELLKDMLEKATNLKDGAANLMKMELNDYTRERVQSEVDQANARIDAITKAIESINKGRKRPMGARNPPPPLSKRTQEPVQVRKDDGHEETRVAKQNISSALKTLLSFSRQPMSPTSGSPASSSSNPVPPTTEAETEKARIETMNRLITVLQRNVRARFEVSMDELITAVTPTLADQASTRARAITYRLLRHALIDRDSVERMLEYPLEWYLVKSLTRDNKHAAEREQAIKLIRTIVEIGSERRGPHMSPGSGRVPLTESIMRALIAIAEHNEDALCQICCETLVEILLIDVDLMARSGGSRVLFQSLAEGPVELTPIVATAFLYIIDNPRTRAYIHPGTDLEIALSGITDAYGKGTSYSERMRSTIKVIAVILRTWSGLLFLCMNDMIAIRSLVDTLRIPSLETREIVLDMFFELLNIETPEWYQTFLDGRRLTIYRKHKRISQQPKEQETPQKNTERLGLTDQFIALLTAIFTKAGLLDALVAILEESASGSNISRKATLLIGEVLQIANKVLPLGVASNLQTIPRIFELASDYSENDHRIVGTTALAAIDSFNRHRSRVQPVALPAKDNRQRSNSIEDHIRRGQRQVEQVRIKLAMQMDDKAFQASIIETQVMLTPRDHTKWNFDILFALVEGPLRNAKRMEEAIRVTKFMRRLMSFFHPFNNRFSDIKKLPGEFDWVKLGCTLLTTLMANADGVRYLASEDEFLPQIVKSFEQLFPFSGTAPPELETVFSKKRMEETLTSGYFEMLGVLSKTKEGLDLLEKHRVFTAFYQLTELRGREDIIRGIIENIDYSNDGHPRIVLSKALTSSYKHIRQYATKYLGKLIQASLSVTPWMLRLLLTQLYDTDPTVRELSVQILEEACENQEILSIVVDMQPTLEHLGECAYALLYKFMSTPVGFRYLYEVGFIEREMDMWLHERNFLYVVQVEVNLSKELSFGSVDDGEMSPSDSAVPPHFYGELAKTELGCQVLYEKGHFSEFAHFIRQHALEEDDYEIIFKLKSVLWAVGNIASTIGGLHFLEEEELIPVLLEIAECSPVLSVRGTCFFVLGLASINPQGAEILDDYGWESTLSPVGLPTGLCIPADVEKFVTIPPWQDPVIPRKEELVALTSQEEVDVITAIGNLANTVIANAASRSLAKMKSKSEYRHVFNSIPFFYRVFHTISTQRYRLPVRRYILGLFNIEFDNNIVNKLVSCSKTLKEGANAPQTNSRPKLQPRVSVFGRPVKRGRQQPDSDTSDDSMDSDEDEEEVKPPVERPISLLPVRRVSGFDGTDQNEGQPERRTEDNSVSRRSTWRSRPPINGFTTIGTHSEEGTAEAVLNS